ncbi:MAG: hypothetical protein J7518_14630 [Nocardioidaceae bacterium]|nr:hypothetical protein [Nocardioidaceae bacterium]
MAEPTLTDLRAVLRERADDVIVPEPPLDAVRVAVRSGRRRTAVRAVAVAGALAAAVAGIVALGIGRHDEHPQPAGPLPSPSRVDELPHGPPTDVAYVVGRTLYLGSTEIELTQDVFGLSQVASEVAYRYRDGQLFLVSTDDPTPTPELIARDAEGPAAISPAGDYLTYQRHTDDGAVTLVVHPIDGGEDLVQAVPAKPSCCDNPFTIDGITGDGVIASMPALGRVWLWRIEFADVTGTLRSAGLERVALAGFPDAYVDQVTPDLLVLSGNINLVAGTVEGDRFVEDDCCAAVRGIRAESYDLRDPEGERVAFVREGLLYVRDLDTMADTTIKLPKAEAGPSLRWEDKDHVLVALDLGSQSVLVRCSTEGRCERVAQLVGAMSLAR